MSIFIGINNLILRFILKYCITHTHTHNILVYLKIGKRVDLKYSYLNHLHNNKVGNARGEGSINLTLIIISQHIHVSNRHIIRLTLIQYYMSIVFD